MRTFAIGLVLGFVFPVISSQAATIRVPSQFATIQSAINAASDLDTVLVSPGTYLENISLSGKAILLGSTNGREVTIIRTARSGGEVITCGSGEGRSTIIDGFAINGNLVSRGIRCDRSSPTIRNCDISNCGGFLDGGGIYCYNSSAFIYRNRIHHNTATGSGPGICARGASTLGLEIRENELFSSLGTGQAIACVFVNQVNIYRNLIRSNSVGIYMNGGDNIHITNNTLAGNASGIAVNGVPKPYLYNNIIVNGSGEAVPGNLTRSDYNNICNNGSNNLPGIHGISVDPLFSDPANNDYSLQSTSPCIDAGDPDPLFNDPDGTRCDIGAFPLQPIIVPPYGEDLSVVPKNDDGEVASLSPRFEWQYADDAPTSQTAFRIQVGEDPEWSVAENWDSGPVTSSAHSVEYDGSTLANRESYWVRVSLFNGVEWGDWVQTSFITHFPTTLHVPSDFSTIQEAVDSSATGDTVLVGPGLYLECINLKGKKILLTSEAGNAATTIRTVVSGVPVITCNSGENWSTVVSGFTLNGASVSRCVLCERSSPIIQYCDILNGNSGYYDGGGVYCYASFAVIRYNTIHDNGAGGSGSGVAVGGTPTAGAEICYNEIFNSTGTGIAIACLQADDVNIHHNILRNNVVNHWAAGGIYLNDSKNTRIVNNTIVSNTHGLVNYYGVTCFLRNNIIVGNTQAALPTGLSQSDYNDVWNNGSNNFPGSNGISVDPLFTDPLNHDYSLQTGSLCLNAGDPAPQYFDPDGTRGDIGALWGSSHDPYIQDIQILGENRLHVLSMTPHFSWKFSTMSMRTQDSLEFMAGTDYDWSVAETWSTGKFAFADTSIIYYGAPLSKGSAYYFRMRVHDGLNWSAWSSGGFRMNDIPRIPSPQFPIDSVVTQSGVALYFYCGPDNDGDALSYFGTISSDTTALTTLDSLSVVTSYSSGQHALLRVNHTLPEGRVFWRVRSYDGYEYSPWSKVVGFWVDRVHEAPLAPILREPLAAANKPAFSLVPSLVWDVAHDNDPFDTARYRLEFSYTADFSHPLMFDSLRTTSFTLSDSLTIETQYWWRVTATDKYGLTSGTATGDFWTWKPGDLNHDRLCDLSDLSRMIAYLVGHAEAFTPRLIGDVNADCRVDLSDLSAMIARLTGSPIQFQIGCQ